MANIVAQVSSRHCFIQLFVIRFLLFTHTSNLFVVTHFCCVGWCGGKKVDEGPKCNWNVKPKDDLDSCCQVHDKCCGTPALRSKECNSNILKCVKKAKCRKGLKGLGCRASKNLLIKPAFKIQKNKVCGDMFGKSQKTIDAEKHQFEAADSSKASPSDSSRESASVHSIHAKGASVTVNVYGLQKGGKP